ncbi:MAG: hypothetical protein DRN91_08605 [Candidatus Alkanophagales archaeon]|nr:MAG: hypothetical protein DRN91_08605 [Candidatus Alkanophagales archaeon]
MIKVALVGNPNVGKTVIFNSLTGARQHVGNWPGVTIEKKVGRCTHHGVDMEIVDLPGTYSLTARSLDELIARNYIVEEKPDVVVDIVDASNLERNMYLTLLLLELEAKVVVALNMMDIAASKGYEVDAGMLSKLLGVPVVPCVAIHGEGIEELKDAIVEAARQKRRHATFHFGEEIEAAIKRIEAILSRCEELSRRYPLRWLAVKLLEGDESVEELVSKSI